MLQGQDPVASAHRLVKYVVGLIAVILFVGFLFGQLMEPTTRIGTVFRLVWYGSPSTPQTTQPNTPDISSNNTNTISQVLSASTNFSDLKVGIEVTDCTKNHDLFIRTDPSMSSESIPWPEGAYLPLVWGTLRTEEGIWWEVQFQSRKVGWIREGPDNVDRRFICPRQPFRIGESSPAGQ